MGRYVLDDEAWLKHCLLNLSLANTEVRYFTPSRSEGSGLRAFSCGLFSVLRAHCSGIESMTICREEREESLLEICFPVTSRLEVLRPEKKDTRNLSRLVSIIIRFLHVTLTELRTFPWLRCHQYRTTTYFTVQYLTPTSSGILGLSPLTVTG